jgi:hypothetical protein
MMQHKNVLILILTLLSVWFYTTAQAASEARLYLTVSRVEPSKQNDKRQGRKRAFDLWGGYSLELRSDHVGSGTHGGGELYFERTRLDLARAVRQSKG